MDALPVVDIRMLKYAKEICFFLVVAAAGLFFMLVPASRNRTDNALDVSGCYIADSQNRLEIFERKIRLNNGKYRKFDVISPVPGKHGYLISIDRVKIVDDEHRLKLLDSDEGWNIDGDAVRIAVPPDYSFIFEKRGENCKKSEAVS